MRTLPDRQEQRELDAVEAAIRETALLLDGSARLELIELVFWQRSHTLQGAAMQVHISYASARRKEAAFVYLVARNLGMR